MIPPRDTFSAHPPNREPRHLHRNDKAVLDALQSAVQHPTAIELHEIVQRNYPRMSRATLYRALQRLEAMGLVIPAGRDGRGRHYDAHTARHDHAICSVCGQLFDLALPDWSLAADTLERFYRAAEAAGVEPETWEIRVRGLCADCQKARSAGE
jgi:Fe2+ or Zn2+ uptake regulation protein